MSRPLVVAAVGVLLAGGFVAVLVARPWSAVEKKVGEAVLGTRLAESAVLASLISENTDHYAFACLDGTASEATIKSAFQDPPRRWEVKRPADGTAATIFYDPASPPPSGEVIAFDRREVEGTVCIIPRTGTGTRARS